MSYYSSWPIGEYLCVKAPGGTGIEVGDECNKSETHFYPTTRWFSEDGSNQDKPFQPISLEDLEGFRFVPTSV